jgi:hypothetical protein
VQRVLQSGWEDVSAGVNLVVIETWNELHEATGIAASREYGTQCLASPLKTS